MKIRKFVSALKLKFFEKNKKYIDSQICGIKLKTIKGSVRKKADQDDAWFFYLAKNNDVIFDIGSNIGYTALISMIQNPQREYLLVDPNPLALVKAAENMIINSFGSKAYYYPAFVGDNNGEKVKFYTMGSGAAGSMFKSHAETAAAINHYFWVNTVTLDFLYSHYNLSPNLIKIDVEGAESFVLNGAFELALRAKPKFFIEMHSNKELSMKENTDRILSWCLKVNYNAWYLKNAKKLIDSDEISHRGKCHLLLLPTDANYPDYLKSINQYDALPKEL